MLKKKIKELRKKGGKKITNFRRDWNSNRTEYRKECVERESYIIKCSSKEDRAGHSVFLRHVSVAVNQDSDVGIDSVEGKKDVRLNRISSFIS